MLTTRELQQALDLRDLSDPAQGFHCMQMLLNEIVAAAAAELNLELHMHRHSPIVAIEDNYDRLRIGSDVATRDQRYTRYVDDKRMLRSHTSAHMPALLQQAQPNSLLAVPGLVYRRDVIDRHHVGEPHQLDMWTVTAHPQNIESLMAAVARAVMPDCRYRLSSRIHPYTQGGVQLDIYNGGEWLELAEGGYIHPEILKHNHGMALGMGLDRALMLRKQIDDIRWLRSPLPQAQKQMENLQPWRRVSVMPHTSRDLSLMTSTAWDEETLGDYVRNILGPRAEQVQSITIRSITAYDEVPPAARLRMGARPGQHNVLLRLQLQSLTHTLTSKEGNQLRNQIYRVLHEGMRSEY